MTRIAVVDDDESVRESLPHLLGSVGFEAVAFVGPEEFLKDPGSGTFDCLILDVAMPGMSGLELLDELKRRSCPSPIIFITANADGKAWENLTEKGVVACLLKPFDEASLLGAVSLALAGGRGGADV